MNTSPFPQKGMWGSVKMGPGVIGRTSTVSAIAMVMLGGALVTSLVVGAYTIALVILSVIAFAFFYYMHTAFSYAKNHKGASVTEGAEYVAYIQATQGAKSKSTLQGPDIPVSNRDADSVISEDPRIEDANFTEDRDA